MRFFIPIVTLLFLSTCTSDSRDSLNQTPEKETEPASSIDWVNFSQDVFDIAQKEDKLVFLEVGANWCHWCHVMDEKTYSDPAVQDYLKTNFILCREDQDSRPDLYAAYKAWGWPAIILFNDQGEELLRLKGYQEKMGFLEELTATRTNPVPISKDTDDTKRSFKADEQQLFSSFLQRIDHDRGAYFWNNKYLHLPGIFHGLRYYKTNDSLKKWTDLTVKNSYSLVDPVWSGVYQYSAKKSWVNQHYEKLLKIQANYIDGYSRYAALTGDKRSLIKAEKIYGYCTEFLSTKTPLFNNSQNADVVNGQDSEEYYGKNNEERRKQGVPSVDEHAYLKENAMLAKSLLVLWAATDNGAYLKRSAEMLDYILSHFKHSSGLYMREEGNSRIFSLEDNLVLMELMLLHAQLKDDEKLKNQAAALGSVIYTSFNSDKGLCSASGDLAIPAAIVDFVNLDAVLLYNYLSHLTGDDLYHDVALELYEKLDKAALFEVVGYLPGLLRAKQELTAEPFHAVYISDGKDDATYRQFYRQILINANPYVICEKATIGHFTQDQELLYSGIPAGNLFMCTSSFCSAPIDKPLGIQEFFNSAQF